MNVTSNVILLTGRPRDACDHLTSIHTLRLVTSVLHCWVIPSIILLLGVPGNALCLCIFWKQGIRERVNCLLFSLAVSDLAKLLALLTLQANCVISQLGSAQEAADWESTTRRQVVRVYRYFNLVSAQLNALMALDRALSVSLPLTAHRILSFGRMMSAVVTVYMVTLAYFVPFFLLFLTSHWTVEPATNATIANVPHHPFHPDIPKHIIGIATGVLMPTTVIIVTVSSVVVVIKLGAARQTRKEMANSLNQKSASQSDTKITKMLLSVCFLFIILMLPVTAGNLVNYLFPEFGFQQCYHNTFSVFFRVVSVASCLNSSVNFVAYVSLSAKFRTTLRQILMFSAVRSTEANTSGPAVSTTSVDNFTST